MSYKSNSFCVFYFAVEKIFDLSRKLVNNVKSFFCFQDKVQCFFLTVFIMGGVLSSLLELPVSYGAEPLMKSRLEILEITDQGEAGKRQILLEVPWRIDAPFWTPDSRFIIYSSRGSIFKIAVSGGSPCRIDTRSSFRCNNDNVISPDGKRLGISDGSRNNSSQIYTIPFEGGVPQLVTVNYPSYLHGWSPDGKWLTYTAMRNGGDGEIYIIPAEGGEEIRLTRSPGLDDGSEFTPDGKQIVFCSTRSGLMQIWKMKIDGSDPVRLSESSMNLWFPHCSPNGKWISCLAYQNVIAPGSHPANKNVELQIMSAQGGKCKTLVSLFGGQGTFNINSWSPDSKKIAFISYEPLETTQEIRSSK